MNSTLQSNNKQLTKPGRESYLSVSGSVPLLHVTIGQMVDQVAKVHPDSVAIVVPAAPTRIEKSYAQIKKEVDSLAAGLLAIGLSKGDRIGIWGPNSYEWYLIFLACMKSGIISVLINPAYQARELLYCVNKVGVKCLVVAEQFKKSNYYNMLADTFPDLLASEPGSMKARNAPSLGIIITMLARPMRGAYTLLEVIRRGSNHDTLTILHSMESQVRSEDVCNIQFTSGTTGRSKGVMLSHCNLINNAYLIGQRLGFSDKAKICLTVPLFHCFGCVVGVLAAIVRGAAVVLPSPHFSPVDALKVISEERCTAVYGTPTMHIDILSIPELRKYDVTCLRHVVTGGSSCPEQVVAMMQEKYTVENITSIYGSTETSPVIFQSLADDSNSLRATTVGYPMEHIEVKIRDKEGKTVDVGQVGEICVRGYCVMKGYWEDSEKSREVIDLDGWYHTGDLGIMLESGHARIVGRLTDMIIRGGENIYPREVEEFLHSHPSIVEAQVFSVPDMRLGEVVCAWIKLSPESDITTKQELEAFCKGKLAHFKIPSHIRFVNTFPKTTSGKIQKFKMRDIMIKELGTSM